MIQLGVRRGDTTQIDSGAGDIVIGDSKALIPSDERRPLAFATVRSDVVDPLTLHVAITGAAVLLGWGLQAGIRALHPSLSGFPLFPLAMIGGILVQLFAKRTGATRYFDRATFERIMGVSLDLLIVAAIASLRLDLFLQNVVPFSLLMLVGIAWTLAAFLFLAPRMVTTYWFEQSITVYGTATGVTAIGLMLLRIVDPENRTPAAQAFAARAIVASPLFGGGLVTATVPLFLQGFGLVPVLVVTTTLALVLYFWPQHRPEAGPA